MTVSNREYINTIELTPEEFINTAFHPVTQFLPWKLLVVPVYMFVYVWALWDLTSICAYRARELRTNPRSFLHVARLDRKHVDIWDIWATKPFVNLLKWHELHAQHLDHTNQISKSLKLNVCSVQILTLEHVCMHDIHRRIKSWTVHLESEVWLNSFCLISSTHAW